MIEPWRRRRLVKGFEEKVEMALKERDEGVVRGAAVLPNSLGAVVDGPEAPAALDNVADHIAEQIVDAVTGSSNTSPSPSDTTSQQANIEAAAAEVVTDAELASDRPIASIPLDPAPPSPPSDSPPPPAVFTDDHSIHSIYATASKGYAHYAEAFQELFSERELVVTQKELTTVALEGAAGGAALMGIVVLLLRPR